MIRAAAATLVLVTLSVCPALAGASDWQEIAPGVKLRLISSDRLDGGTTLAGLELDMPETTNTYWRIPGETGIPTEFDFSASTGIGATQVHWPYPQIDRSRGYLDYAYFGPVVLPFEVEAQEVAMLDVGLVLGVCEEICIPVTTRLTLPLNFAAPDEAQSIRLDQAMAQTPFLWDKPGEPFATVEAGLDGSLHVYGADPSIDPESVIADVGDPAILFETPQKSPDRDLWTLKPLGGAAKKGLEGSSVQLTFLTPDGPYAVTREIAPSQP
jgi:DsbC/DsbD-like thiol-disulfide interchange protein